jgi:pimeloyl-ACP methyl ester carboxylesterase
LDYGSSKQVLGVYIGWNARSKILPLRYEPLASLTFWSKKTVADRIAQSAVTTKTISAISAILSREGGDENQFIVIGHSFGARLLFSATGQSLIYDTQKAHPGFPGGTYDEIKGIANAVILLNPAFEASIYTSFDAITRFEEQFSTTQLPLLLSISSSADVPTQWAFPAGQLIGWAGSEKERTTLGNYLRYQTHSLEFSSSRGCMRSPPPNDQDDLSEKFDAHGICMYRLRTADMAPSEEPRVYQRRNPFLIARTGPDIISGHTDIWNDRFSAWLFEYVKELGKLRRDRLG